MILVDAAGVTVSRPGKPLFEGLSVTVASGDRLGVVGINGGGKSTLLKVLAGTVEPEAGTVRRGRGARLSVLDQDAPLPPGTVARGGRATGWEVASILDRLGMGGAARPRRRHPLRRAGEAGGAGPGAASASAVRAVRPTTATS